MNTIQGEYTSNVDVLNVQKTVQKYTENHENSNEYTEKPINILSSDHESKTLESIENQLEELKIKNEHITDKGQTIGDSNKLSNNQIITTMKAEINEIQDEIENGYFNAIVDKMVKIDKHVDQFIAVVNDLKLVIEDSYENKEIISEIMEVSEYLRAQYAIQVTENQRNFTEQISKHVRKIDQLKAFADIKIKEVNTLEKRFDDQKLCIDFYEKLIENITHKVKQLKNENDQLVVPNDDQTNFSLLLRKKLVEMDELLETKNGVCNEFEGHIKNLVEEKDLFAD
ncbi:uncharacterized protein LOC114122768 [Aphis gossypii]|uniref:uncharacterized protein LOC114122768 n=1 Tax=Aphis gossypii TaxID=80765 RepID=UPI0021592DE2|nr:uncharacterized protein LOC114122768 [Aphis gossypii]